MPIKKQPGKNSNPLTNVANSVNKKAADYTRAKQQAKLEAKRIAKAPIKGVGVKRP